ncbi:MAG TPA: hypothetical protein VNV66_12450 [Pilimelia sp.]|nr:hypothetical protein [Pilimelia sp.]
MSVRRSAAPRVGPGRGAAARMDPARGAAARVAAVGAAARLALVGLAASGLGVVAACGNEPGTPPTTRPGPPRCPDTYVGAPAVPTPRAGHLVPAGATTALLCVYPLRADPRDDRLGAALPAPDGKLAGLVKHLNGLRPDRRASDDVSCVMVGREQYRVVLGYPDDRHLVVHVEVNCDSVEADGARRRLRHETDLTAFWPGFRLADYLPTAMPT